MWRTAKRKTSICIVDDDLKEIERARRHLQELNFCVGGGQSIEAALEDLRRQSGRKKPNIFLVDMYGPEEQADPQAGEKLAEARAAYLRAEAKFYKTLDEMGQTTTRGFKNVKLLRSKYRRFRVPVAFFTRKGTLNNVLAAYEENPECPVLKKPDPSANRILQEELTADRLAELYDQAFEEGKTRIGEDINLVIERFSWRSKYGDLLIGVLLGVIASMIANLIGGCASYLFSAFVD